ncbi:MAG: M13 family metallopeptidase [Stygiobacter sp.]|uniref:M13 family metallopeptidase n=1 Tax=Stygiobacter electus TaxID=3032292 RepID=A0AAE3NXK1_9BACT|nr:M13 family metallopeptidase [Stygiobacter electus]MDF1611916.1 M13 family metallopeptidase [Stygiobacter electus]
MKREKNLWWIPSLILIIFSILLLTTNVNAQYKNGFDLSNLDKSADPTKNFYQFAVGGWVKNNPIPDDQVRWGSFTILAEDNNKILREIIEAAAAKQNWEKGSAKQKIGDFYAVAMDSVKIEKLGYKPIIPDLKKIDALNKKDLVKFLAEEYLNGNGYIFNFAVTIDAKKSDSYIPHLSQGGLGLPDVEYYTKDDNRSKEIREKYLTHIANMFKLIDVNPELANQYAQKVLDIETKLAKISNTRLENRDPIKTYNKMTVDNLVKLSPDFNWKEFFDGLGLTNLNLVNVAQPKFYKGLGEVLNNVPFDDWKIYFKWNVLRSSANALSSPFVNERFDFTQRYLNGAKAMPPRWKRVVQSINMTMGELLGQLYVEKYFPPEAKERARKIVDNLLVSMKERIEGLEWMSDETKKQALTKLSTFGVKIGYPDKWRDYSELEIARDSYAKNLERVSKWSRKQMLARLGKPVDKQEWFMSPQTVNASYNPTKNEITFPAGILQPPFYNQNADDAVNYGAMGAVIGHEITHGFDDQGRKFDEKGNIREWWTKEDGQKFQERAQKLVNEYNNFVVVDTFKVNGALTLGENIADLGGLTVSLNAFKKTEQYKKGEMIDGFTPLQRFFLGWAQVWATNARDEYLKMQVKTDVHSPSVQRVNGPLMNIPEFWEAFNVKPGDPMRNPDDKIVKIW